MHSESASSERRDDAELVGPAPVDDASTIAAICRFRASVWGATGLVSVGAFPAGSWRDDVDESSRHWVIRRAGAIVAAARLSVHESLEHVPEAEEYLAAGLRLEGPVAAPARVVVAPSAQRRGLASSLIAAQDRGAIEAGAISGVSQSSPAMCRLRERHGWRRVATARPDPRFPGVAFQVMVRAFGAANGPAT